MALFGKGSPRLYPQCFDRQPPLFTICLGSPHDFLWQRQPPYLSTLFQEVAPVVSNAQEAPMTLFGKGSPRLYPHCFDRQPPLSLICLGCSHHYPHLSQVAPVVSNLVRKPPQQRQPPCCQHGINRQPPGNLQEAPVAFICGIVHKVAPL